MCECECECGVSVCEYEHECESEWESDCEWEWESECECGSECACEFEYMRRMVQRRVGGVWRAGGVGRKNMIPTLKMWETTRHHHHHHSTEYTISNISKISSSIRFSSSSILYWQLPLQTTSFFQIITNKMLIVMIGITMMTRIDDEDRDVGRNWENNINRDFQDIALEAKHSVRWSTRYHMLFRLFKDLDFRQYLDFYNRRFSTIFG